MDELMKIQSPRKKGNRKQELTCSVLFTKWVLPDFLILHGNHILLHTVLSSMEKMTPPVRTMSWEL